MVSLEFSRAVWSLFFRGIIKINTDVGFCGEDWLGFGAVIRDDGGVVKVIVIQWINSDCTAEMVEYLAGRWGLEVVRRLGFIKIVFEFYVLNLIS